MANEYFHCPKCDAIVPINVKAKGFNEFHMDIPETLSCGCVLKMAERDKFGMKVIASTIIDGL